MATAGDEGISEWVAANSTTKPIGKRFYEVKVLDWRRPFRHRRMQRRHRNKQSGNKPKLSKLFTNTEYKTVQLPK